MSTRIYKGFEINIHGKIFKKSILSESEYFSYLKIIDKNSWSVKIISFKNFEELEKWSYAN